MGVELAELRREEFAAALAGLSPEPLAPEALEALWAHYQELRRWSPRLALIGRGTAEEVLVRHYGESLAALPFVPVAPRAGGGLVDLGSGAGFPGFVLAAARPGWPVTLVEARQKKWAFLEAARRRAALSCRCLDARVGARLPAGLPERIEMVTVRALRLPAEAWRALLTRRTPGARLLLWSGRKPVSLPAELRITAERPLPGATDRRLLIAEPCESP
ncbi:MAG TPA: RsmG family class I SAM-dependent methyltransferase [Thermoanaerobaculia bacterium]|nr:RsmG family class I SAM-dependent methyltransferase [Thermoanaerobaculia bacterium]